MSLGLKTGRAEVLASVREHRETEPVRLVLELVRLRVEALKEEMITAGPERLPALQGAIMELKNLTAAIACRPAEKQDKDGAYA